MNPIITINKSQPLAVAVGEGPVDAGVAGGGEAPVLLMDHVDAAVLCSVFITDGAAVVRAAVVHKDQLKVLEGLSQNAVHTAMQVRLHFIDRYNNTNQRHFFALLLNCGMLSPGKGKLWERIEDKVIR